MKTRLLLPKIDAQIAKFVEEQPACDADYVPTLDPTYVVCILYFGHVYRHIICFNREEFKKLDSFLDSLGYLKRVDPIKGFYRSWELID